MFLALLGCLLLLNGCSSESGGEGNSVTAVAERGPVRMTAEAAPRQVLIGDSITVSLRVETPPDNIVAFPAETELASEFFRKVEAAEPRPGAEGGLVWQCTLTADALESGLLQIPPVSIKYARQPTEPDAEPRFDRELAVGPLEIEVLSALTAQDDVLNPRDITGVLAPPRKPLPAWAWVLIIVGGLLGIALFALLIRWIERRARRPAPPIAPEVWALRVLAELEAAGLIEHGQAREYYYRLSETVRVYIERQFGLMAPEMTTEEFLVALARDRGAVPYDADRLRGFLESCDLVKYAALVPGTEEAAQAIGMARGFIDATAAACRHHQATPGDENRGQAA
jgi:hypothetical protein